MVKAGRELLRFGIVGVIGMVVDVSVLYLAMASGLGWHTGRICSFLAAVTATWQCNRRYTFTSRREQSLWLEWWRYLAAMSGGGAINFATYSLVTVTFPTLPLLPMVAVAAGSIAGLGVNFIGAKYLVFKTGGVVKADAVHAPEGLQRDKQGYK